MYPLKTARLRIEPLRPDHAPKVVEALGDTRLYTYLPDDPPSLESLQRRYDFLANGRSPDGEEQWLNWIVFLVDSETPVGTFQPTLPIGKQGLSVCWSSANLMRNGDAVFRVDAPVAQLTTKIATVRSLYSVETSVESTQRNCQLWVGLM